MTIALIGNQNTGKTMLFNRLTGANQHVGNFPGVTVERKSGVIKGHRAAELVDLPGVYSLSPYTSEEIVTRDFLINGKPDGVLNILDATNLERNLYLTVQLLELGLPTVVALNMMDELTGGGGAVDAAKLSAGLGVPVVPISAQKNDGVDELLAVALATFEGGRKPDKVDFCAGAAHRALHSIAHIVEDHAKAAGVTARFAASKLADGDEPMLATLKLHPNDAEAIEHIIEEMERELGTDREAALADTRYNFITALCAGCVVKPAENVGRRRSVRIDAFLTHRVFGIPIFLGVMALIFYLSFSVFGAIFSGWLEAGIGVVIEAADGLLVRADVNPVLRSLIIDGAFAGVGSVLSFLPIIITLFFFLSILEDSGYMARVAFIMDAALRKLGMSGRGFVPLLIGFGCSVPAVMATRAIPGERDKRLAMTLIPFMSCTAKLPVYAVFVAAFFPDKGALVMISLYILGMVLAVLCGLALKKTVYGGQPSPFIMELPNYRLPGLKSVGLLLWGKAKDFVTRAFTVIFLASIVVWALQSFDMRFNITDDVSASWLAKIGGAVGVVLAPAGFGNWLSSTALITGFIAKEAVVGTLAVLTGSADLSASLPLYFTNLSALSFLVFTLLYTPCVAAMAAVKREIGTLGMLRMIGFQLVVAWVAAVVVYQVGGLWVGW